MRGYAVELVGHSELEVTDDLAVERFFRPLGVIDLLVNAAGAYGDVGMVRDISPAAWRRAIEVNLVGVYACCHHAMKRMPAGGHIINLAGGGRGPMVMRSGYASAKSALWRLTETLAAEEQNLHVNAIAPGPMDSRMQDAVVGIAAPWADTVRAMRRNGQGEVPVANTLRALDYLMEREPTGQLLFARDFGPRLELAVAR